MYYTMIIHYLQKNSTIPYDMLSDYCKKVANEYQIKVCDVMKLIPNLGNKTNYVLHYRNLQLYLSLGMNLTKAHRMLKFKQSDWKKIYISIWTLKKEQMLLIVLKKIFLNWWLIVSMTKKMENLRKRIRLEKKCQASKQRKRFFKIHQQTNS